MVIISPFKERKKLRYLIFILGGAILGVIFVVWYNFFSKPKPSVLPPSPSKEIKINFEVLENPILKELQPFEDISSFEGEIGRENPFSPY